MNIRVEITPDDHTDCETLLELGAKRDLVRDAVLEVFPLANVRVLIRVIGSNRPKVLVTGVEDADDVRGAVDVLLGQVAS